MKSEELKLVSKKDVNYLTSPMLLEKSIFLAFTTRQGGFSASPYNSLNLAFHVGDSQEAVIKNRRKIAKHLSFNLNNLTCAQQIHGTEIKHVEDKDAGSGSLNYETAFAETDGLITDVPNVPIALFFADCLPVVLVNLEPKIVGIAHAGHKGLFGGIVGRLVKEFKAKTSLEKTFAFLGPSVEACCYEVGPALIEKFRQKFPSIVEKNDNALDLKTIAAFELQKAGLKQKQIIKSSYCTCCNNDLFFSYRKSKITGRQAAIVYIGEE